MSHLATVVSGMGLEVVSLGPTLPDWCGPGHPRLGRRMEGGHLVSACLQDVSGDRWESLNVGALHNIFLGTPPANAARINM